MQKTLSIVAVSLLMVGSCQSGRADDAPASDSTNSGKAGNNAPETVVNGANVGDFLGSGVTLDRNKMDATLDHEYNTLGRLDPLKPGEVAPSVNPWVEDAALAQAAKTNKKKKKGFKGFIKSIGNAFGDAASMIGFPVGPDDDDARMDKWDDM